MCCIFGSPPALGVRANTAVFTLAKQILLGWSVGMAFLHWYNIVVQEMNVSEFGQRCLALMDDLPADGILITNHGHPVAKLTPVRESCADLIGSVPELANRR
jgi:hypothetical protein